VKVDRETFIYFLQPKREGVVDAPTDDERFVIEAHFQYLLKLCDEGVVVLAGPSTEPPPTGIVIVRTGSREEAQALMDNDPAIEGGVMKGRLSAFKIAMMSSMVSDQSKAIAGAN